jgi:hypothetical protein
MAVPTRLSGAQTAGWLGAPGLDLGLVVHADHDRALGARPRTEGWNGVRVVATLEAAQQSLDKGGIQVEVDAQAGSCHVSSEVTCWRRVMMTVLVPATRWPSAGCVGACNQRQEGVGRTS